MSLDHWRYVGAIIVDLDDEIERRMRDRFGFRGDVFEQAAEHLRAVIGQYADQQAHP